MFFINKVHGAACCSPDVMCTLLLVINIRMQLSRREKNIIYILNTSPDAVEEKQLPLFNESFGFFKLYPGGVCMNCTQISLSEKANLIIKLFCKL